MRVIPNPRFFRVRDLVFAHAEKESDSSPSLKTNGVRNDCSGIVRSLPFMSRPSRYLLIAMSTAFGICIFGLLLGMIYYLYAVIARQQTLENVLGNNIPYYKALGGIGLLGFTLFFAFLISLMTKNNSDNKPR
jgi:hypothetical protein